MKTLNLRWLKAMIIPCVFLSIPGTLKSQQVLTAQPETWYQGTATDVADQYSLDVAIDGYGCAYVAGYFTSLTTDFLSTGNTMYNTSTLGTEDGYLAKFDKVSNTYMWAVQVGGTGSDRCAGVATIADGDGGYSIYVVGTFSATATFQSMDGNNVNLVSWGGKDGFLAKYDESGNLIWVYDIGGFGTPTHDWAFKVSVNYVDPSGTVNRDVYVVGFNGSGTGLLCHGSSTNLSPTYAWGGGADGYLVNYNETATSVTPTWIRTVGSSGAEDLQCVSSIPGSVSVGGTVKKSGASLQISGTATVSLATSGAGDAIVANYDQAGNNNWYQLYGGTGSTPEIATCVTIDADGNTYAGGFYSSPGSIFVPPANGKTTFVVKVNAVGTLLWRTAGGSSGDDFPMGIRVDGCSKHLFVAGNFTGPTFTFQTGSTNGYASGASMDNYLLELNPGTGIYLTGTLQTMGGFGTDILFGLANDRLDRVYAVGATDDDWKPFTSSWWLNNAGGYDGFIWRYNEAQWPATCDIGTVWESRHCGVSVDDCNIYAFGHMISGASPSFPGPPVSYGGIPITSTTGLDQDCDPLPSYDIYLTTSDRFGHYTGFANVVYGSANEFALDQSMCSNGDLIVGGYANAYCANLNVVCGSDSYALTQYYPSAVIPYGLVVKTTNSGVPLWSEIISPQNLGSAATVTGVDVDNVNNCVYVCGNFNGTIKFGTTTVTLNNATPAGFIAKYDGSGTLLWAKKNISDVNGGYAQTTDISVDKFSPYNAYVTGTYTTQATCNGASSIALPVISGSDIFVQCCSQSNGDLVGSPLTYSTASGTNDYAHRLLYVAAQQIYVTAELDGIGGFIGRCHLTGTPGWMAVTTGSGNATGIVADQAYVYVTGTAGSTFASVTSPLAPPVTTTNVGPSVLKMEKISLIPSCYQARNFGGDGLGIAQDNVTGNLYVGGYGVSGITSPLYGIIQEFSPESCDYSDRHANPEASSTPAGITGAQLTSATIYPNPANETATLKISEGVNFETPATLLIVDMTGRIVKRVDGISNTETSIDFSDMQPGIYLFEVLQNDARIGAGTIVHAQ